MGKISYVFATSYNGKFLKTAKLFQSIVNSEVRKDLKLFSEQLKAEPS